MWAYATTTACDPGDRLAFRTGGHTGAATVRVEDEVDGSLLHKERFTGSTWELQVGPHWRSGLYRAVFVSDEESEGAPDRHGDSVTGADSWGDVRFVVRSGTRRAPVLVPLPFATWQAYNRAGVPGESVYWTESPQRASHISFDRPGGGPPPERWEHGMLRWLRATGTDADYCSNLDLHLDPDLLEHYRLLLIPGHDEYWTWEMRDAVELFTRRGGNVAIFGANTAWWQMRLVDGGRTMVCYRDAVADPVVAAGEPERATVEWSSAPVHRPENSMTGLSYRLGAGCWVPNMEPMYKESYTVRFPEHWVFEGTGLEEGEGFARGGLGYETDAAEIDESAGAPRVTGRDGTPSTFTVLATADLRHWAAYGQGGAATMGVFTSGKGTVFNAGTVNWGAVLDDPVVDRITRNVVSRLGGAEGPGAGPWLVCGTRQPMTAMASAGRFLYGLHGPRGREELCYREACAQNVPWLAVEPAHGMAVLASPRDAVDGASGGLYTVHRDRTLFFRPAGTAPAGWTAIGRCPAPPRALAIADNRFFLLGEDDHLWSCPLESTSVTAAWACEERVPQLVALTALNGRLVAVDRDDRLIHRLPMPDATWSPMGAADGTMVLTAHAGGLYGQAPGRPLRRTDPFALSAAPVPGGAGHGPRTGGPLVPARGGTDQPT